MSSSLGNNLSELDRLLLELNAVQHNPPSGYSAGKGQRLQWHQQIANALIVGGSGLWDFHLLETTCPEGRAIAGIAVTPLGALQGQWGRRGEGRSWVTQCSPYLLRNGNVGACSEALGTKGERMCHVKKMFSSESSLFALPSSCKLFQGLFLLLVVLTCLLLFFSLPDETTRTPSLPSGTGSHYGIPENTTSLNTKPAAPVKEKPKRNGGHDIEDVCPSVESLLDELESSVPSPV